MKIVIGSTSIKVFVDQARDVSMLDASKVYSNVSEMSLIFPSSAVKKKGIISTITRELVVNDIHIIEILTASPELLIYLKEEYVLKAYEVIKNLSKA